MLKIQVIMLCSYALKPNHYAPGSDLLCSIKAIATFDPVTWCATWPKKLVQPSSATIERSFQFWSNILHSIRTMHYKTMYIKVGVIPEFRLSLLLWNHYAPNLSLCSSQKLYSKLCQHNVPRPRQHTAITVWDIYLSVYVRLVNLEVQLKRHLCTVSSGISRYSTMHCWILLNKRHIWGASNLFCIRS